MRTFPGKVAAFAGLAGFMLVAVLAGAGYTLVSTIRVADEALSTYADELILAWSLQEAHERRLASGRGYLISPDETMMADFEGASADANSTLAHLRERVRSADGILLLDESARALTDHDRALRSVMAMKGGPADVSAAWRAQVRPKASRASEALDAFIRHKERLLAREKERVGLAQQRAAWVMGITALAAVLLAFFGGGRLLRSAQRTYAAEKGARTASEHERAFLFSLLDQLPIGIVAADETGTIMHVSRFAKKMLITENLPLSTGKTQVIADWAQWSIFRSDGSPYPPEDRPLTRAMRNELVANEEVRSASDRIYSVTAGPVRDEEGKTIAAIGAFVDVTERRRAEKERELFIGALGHDLRNPLQAITMAADSLVLRADVPDVAKRPAVRIASSAKRMSRLIGDLLDFARSRHGAIPITPEDCELREIAAEVIAEIKLGKPDRDIRIEPQGGCDGRWDRARMVQVFQNLLGNAVEHGVAEAPITVRTGCDGVHVWAKVTNRGSLPPEERGRIFEPFRARPTSKGLGLGLYIVRAIVEAHGGTITVDSDGAETTFAIRLPIHARAQAREEHRASA